MSENQKREVENKSVSSSESSKPRSEKEGLFNFVKEMGSALITALIFIVYVIQAFVIPTGSMEKSLHVGDFLLGLKFMYGAPIIPGIPKVVDTYWKFPGVVNPKRGDVVIFKYPGKSGENYIKRCIAVAGDTVQVDGKYLRVNGKVQIPPDSARWIRDGKLLEGITHFAPVYVPKKGDTLDIANAPLREFIFYKHLVHQEHPYSEVTESFGLLINGVDYTDSTIVVEGVDSENPVIKELGLSNGSAIKFSNLKPTFEKLYGYGDWTYYNYYLNTWKSVLEYLTGSKDVSFTHHLYLEGKELTSYVTKWESYFMMGDNRDNSADSRYWGFVNRNFIKAKAAIIYFSFGGHIEATEKSYKLQQSKKIRWNRFGKLIRYWDGMPEAHLDRTPYKLTADDTLSDVIDTFFVDTVSNDTVTADTTTQDSAE